MKSSKRFTTIIGGALLALSLTACQSMNTGYVDRYYHDAPTVALKGDQPSNGTWQTFDMIIAYHCQNGPNLQVSGTATFGEHYQMLYERVRSLDLYLFILDSQNLVLASTRIAEVRNGSTDDPISFSASIPMVDGATTFSFGYEGKTLAGDPDASGGGGGKWFYKLPLSDKP